MIRPSRCVKRFFSEKTRPRCSSRSNLVKGRPPHSPRTKCPSLQFPGLRRPLDQSLRPVILRRKVARDTVVWLPLSLVADLVHGDAGVAADEMGPTESYSIN